MQIVELGPPGTSCAPLSNNNDSPAGVQLSHNMMNRLEMLARWRINPALMKVQECGPEFHGGYAMVLRALLTSSVDDTRDQVVESNGRNLKSNDRVPKSTGDNQCGEVKERKKEPKHEEQEAYGGSEQESDHETSGGRKAVAVKKMKVETQDDVVRVLGLAVREAEFLIGLSHENIIKLEGFVEDVSRNMIWLVFTWEDNGTLKAFVDSVEWEIPERISLICDVSEGIEYLHSRKPPICHGDLKSVNILVNSKCRALITDFGSAHYPVTNGPKKEGEPAIKEPQFPAPSLEATHCPATNTITLTSKHYTLRWAAPELLEKDDASLASDIWAFGCVVYEVMTNSIPFQDVKDAMVIQHVVRGDLPSISSDARMLLIQALCSLVVQCWNTEPSARPTARECRTAIKWMPMIAPNPARTTDAAGLVDTFPELLMKLGDMHQRQSDYPKAVEYYLKALGVYVKIFDIKGKAGALLGLAEVHRLQSEYSKASEFYSDCLQIWKDAGDTQGGADALWGLAELHRQKKEHRKAIKFYSEWIDSWGNIDIGLRPENQKAGALWSLAEMRRAQKKYNQAVALYSECLQIWTDIGHRQGRAEALWGLAEVHRAQNKYNQAVALYSECLQIRTDIGHRQGRAEALWSLAEVHRAQKEYNQAVALYSDCLQIRTDIGHRQGRAEALWGLAKVYRVQNKYSQAVHFYAECLDIWTDIGHPRRRALALQGLAELHRTQNKYSEAVMFYSGCLQIWTDVGYKEGRAKALWGLAGVHQAQKEYDQAVTFYTECLQLQTDIGNKLGRVKALWGLAEVHLLRNEYSRAVQPFFEAMKFFTGTGNNDWGAASFLFRIADVNFDQGDYISAILHYRQSTALWEKIRNTHNEALISKDTDNVR